MAVVECGGEWARAGSLRRFQTTSDLGLMLPQRSARWFGPAWSTRPAGWSSVWPRLGRAPGTASSQPAPVGGGRQD